jgi:hypothetical protein
MTSDELKNKFKENSDLIGTLDNTNPEQFEKLLDLQEENIELLIRINGYEDTPEVRHNLRKIGQMGAQAIKTMLNRPGRYEKFIAETEAKRLAYFKVGE